MDIKEWYIKIKAIEGVVSKETVLEILKDWNNNKKDLISIVRTLVNINKGKGTVKKDSV